MAFLSSCGGNDEPTKYVYYEFNINDCYDQMEIITKELDTIFSNPKKNEFIKKDILISLIVKRNSLNEFIIS